MGDSQCFARGRALRVFLVLLASAVLVSGCVSAARREARQAQLDTAEAAKTIGSGGGELLQPRIARQRDQTGVDDVSPVSSDDEVVAYRLVPELNDAGQGDLDRANARPLLSSKRLDVSIPPQSVPAFVNTVFGELLGIGFSFGDGVAQRREVVSFRTARNITEADLYETAKNTLKDFGIAVVFENGQVRIVEQDLLKRDAPIFIRARASESVPSGLRPVFMFVDLLAIKANEMSTILQSAFPDRKKLSVKTNASSNSLTLSGLPGDVERALEIVNQMDELRFAGTRMVTYRVHNWDTKELGKTLQEILTLEGFSVGSNSASARAITLFPVEYTREILILARRDDMLEYAVEAARRLDNAAHPGEERQARVYRAEYYDAKELVGVLKQVYEFKNQGKPKEKKTARGNREKGAADGSFVVDPQGNRIIFFATQTEYIDILRLVRQIDKPAKEVLIEVTIAEITLNDNVQLGLEGLLSDALPETTDVSNVAFGGTTGGLRGLYLNGDMNFRAEIRALAQNDLVNILSTPRVVTKSGAVANVQVGTDVPIITSQAAANSQTSGSTNVLQSVQYRKTGIILKLEPLVFSDNRIDLTISQEVSSAEVNQNSSISSPTISNRSIETQLSLQDGQSAVMGGLIENRYTRNDSGVPFLKDLPLLGRLFSSQSLTASRTVLMVLVTPYILSTRGDRDEVVQSFSDIVNDAFEQQVRGSSTLTRPRSPLRVGNR